MAMPIQDHEWRPIDEAIFANLKISAIMQIRAIAGCGVADAIDLLSDRYSRLRAEAPERFTCDHEAYWADFYS